MSKKLLFLIPVLLLALACNKSKNNHPVGDRREMLKNSTWRVVEMRDNGKIMQLGCKQDDLWIFPESGNGTLDDGADRCTADENTTFNFFISGDQRDFYILNMSNRTSYGSYVSESIRFKWKINYMTTSELDVDYYYPEEVSGVQHFYEIRFARVQ